jgi:3-oxoacyl-[acyl-carrier protein] reductase
MNIADAKVLITGGTAGIGLETARLLSERGARVAICGRDAERLNAVAPELGCVAIQADVSEEADCVRVVKEAIEGLGGYNVLVNNAAFGAFAPLVSMTWDALETMYRTNVFGAMAIARESAKYFVEQDYGNILNVGSTAGDKGMAGGTAYCSTKAALKSMTESWRAELRPSNVRVVLIKPSEVVTEFAGRAGFPQEDSPHKLHGIDIAYAILHALEQPDVGFVPEYPVWATNPNKGK